MQFELGEVVFSQKVSEQLKKSKQLAIDINRAMSMYIVADFSEMECQKDIDANLHAVKTGKGRIFAIYNTVSAGKIYIITERNKNITTILFPEEY